MANAIDPNHLFTLRVPGQNKADSMIIVHAFTQYPVRSPSGYGHHYIDVEVRQGGKVIFERGTLYCGVNAYTSTDGIAARELVLSLVAMKPGNTDEDYFADYTPEQLAWAEANGEYLSMIRECRYCDSKGNVKS